MAIVRQVSNSLSPVANLTNKVTELVSKFHDAWKSYPKSSLSLMFSHDLGHQLADVYNLYLPATIEAVLHKFNEYRSVKAIRDDFRILRDKWEEVCKKQNINQENAGFYHGFDYLLLMIESHFIDTFLQKLSLPTLNVTFEEKELSSQPKDSQDIEKISKKYQDDLKNELEKSFLQECTAFRKQLNESFKPLNDRIAHANNRLNIINERKLGQPRTQRIKRIEQLIKQELQLAVDCYDVEEVKQELDQLQTEQKQLLEQNKQKTTDFLTKQAGIQDAGLLFDVQNEFKDVRARLKKINNIIDDKKRRYGMLSEQKNAMDALNELLIKTPKNGFNQDLAQYQYDHYYKYDMTRWMWNNQVVATYNLLIKHYTDLNDKLKMLSQEKTTDEIDRQTHDIESLQQLKQETEHQLHSLEQALRDKNNQMISLDAIRELRLQLIDRHRETLYQYAATMPVIPTIQDESILRRRQDLDVEWEKVLQTETDLSNAKDILKEKIFNNIPKSSNAETHKTQRILKDVYQSLFDKMTVREERFKPQEVDIVPSSNVTAPEKIESGTVPSIAKPELKSVIEEKNSPNTFKRLPIEPYQPKTFYSLRRSPPVKKVEKNTLSLKWMIAIGLLTAVVAVGIGYFIFGPVVTLAVIAGFGFAAGAGCYALGKAIARCCKSSMTIPDQLKSISIEANRDLMYASSERMTTTAQLSSRFDSETRISPSSVSRSELSPHSKSSLWAAEVSANQQEEGNLNEELNGRFVSGNR